MKFLVSLLVVLSIVLSGCGGTVFVSAFSNPGVTDTVFVSGTVTIVHLTFASDSNGNSITVTVVTLAQRGSAQDLTFCGSQGSQFPLDTFMTVNFKPGTTCSTLIAVKRG